MNDVAVHKKKIIIKGRHFQLGVTLALPFEKKLISEKL
jgi:hypothetical protein